jgi:hypothetical protein
MLMKLFTTVALLVAVFLTSAGTVSAGVTYDFVSSNDSEVIGTLEFAATSNASAISGWSDSGSFSSLLEGGISGFTWMGLTPVSGDLSGSVSSLDGSELDGGNFSSGLVTFSPGNSVLSLSFNIPEIGFADSVGEHTSFGSFTFTGDWLLRPVPEPATMSLLAVGGLALIRRRRVGR